MGICTLEKAEAFVAKMMQTFKELRPEVTLDFLLNRMLFIEVLLMYVVDSTEAQAEESRPSKADYLQFLFDEHIHPFAKGVGCRVEETCTKFREQYIWQEENNQIFKVNMEGIMAVFDKYSEPHDKGFTNKSAFRVLRGIGTTVKDKIIQQ